MNYIGKLRIENRETGGFVKVENTVMDVKYVWFYHKRSKPACDDNANIITCSTGYAEGFCFFFVFLETWFS